eukprot:222533_1
MENQNKKKKCIGYQPYLIWNGIRFLTIGILIFLANSRHNEDLQKIQDDCCKCYYISTEPDQHDIDGDKRFDLSYCMPTCTDCNYCEQIKHTTPAPIDHTSCKWEGYQEPKSWHNLNIFIRPNFNKVTGCHKNVSITSMYMFAKSYTTYGNWALAMGLVYFFAMGILLWCFKDRYDTISIFIFIYNVVMAELCLYWLFKPHQYHRQTIDYETTTAECEVDLISSDAEDMLTIVIFTSFGLLFLQIIYCIGSCCKLCKKACCIWSQGDNRRSTITSHLIDEDGNPAKCDKGCCCYYLWMIIGVIVIIIMLCFAVLLCWAHFVMIDAAYKSDDDKTKMVYIWIVNVFLLMSLLDIFCFPFCKQNVGWFIFFKVKTKLSAISSSDDMDL